jgi:hypothetical protein
MPTPSTLMADKTLWVGLGSPGARSRKEFGNVCAVILDREGAAVCSYQSPTFTAALYQTINTYFVHKYSKK